MKTLVYENYSKFISATDTIHKMKSNVESMESEMGRLNETISGISTQSKVINEALEPNRNKVQQLNNAYNSLKRLQFIFELPNRLQYCLLKGKYSQAVKYYSKARKLLSQYSGMPAFKGIKRDCDLTIGKVKKEIEKGMSDPNISLSKFAEETKLLVLLGEDTHQLWTQYIDIQLSTLQKKQDQQPAPSTIKDLVLLYITPLDEIVGRFESLFLDNNTVSIADLDEKEKEDAKKDLLNAVQPFIDTFFNLTAQFIQLPTNISTENQPTKQVEYLAEIKTELANSAGSLSSVTRIDERLSLLTTEWENDIIRGFFDSILMGLEERVDNFTKRLEESSNDTFELKSIGITEFIEDIQTWIVYYMTHLCLQPLKKCLDISNEETVARIQFGIRKAWTDLADTFESICKNSKLDKTLLQILMLVGSRIFYDLADNGIYQVYSVFSIKFNQDQSNSHDENYPSPNNAMDPRVIPDMNDMIERYLSSGQIQLNKQMMQDGYQLSSRLQEAYLFGNMNDSDEQPSQVSNIWHDIAKRMRYIENLVELVYPQQSSFGATENAESEFEYRLGSSSANDNEPYSRQIHSTLSLATSTSETPSGLGITPKFGSDMAYNMMNNIDKLFAERVDVYRKVDPTPLGVCSGLMLILFKSFLETIRETGMSATTCQQVQIDAEYARRIAWPYVGEEKWATTVLQEVISCAYSRCRSPKSLSQEELELILSRE
ncbi:hypothetical protein K501DRAFT_221225 [Backusella circina FSU 941]|nr:hypothetical protein K501DRAFT_221225 [Backusella circina FSU 941]